MKKILNYKYTNIILALLVFPLLFILSTTGILSRYYSGILLSVCINVILAVSLNLTTGFLGQLTLGHAGFMAVGAYASAYMSKEVLASLPEPVAFVLAILFGALLAMLFGVIIGVPALRVRGDYLAIVTLAFGEVIKTIINNLNFVGGAKGYMGIPRVANIYWAYGFALITTLVIYLLIKSRHGRAIISIREDEIASEASGINTSRYKILAFIVAAFFAGVAGGLYAHYIGNIEPGYFDYNKSIEILVIVVLGGMGSLKGSIISAGALTILPELLRGASKYRTFLYAVVLIVVMLVRYSESIKNFISKHKVKKGASS